MLVNGICYIENFLTGGMIHVIYSPNIRSLNIVSCEWQ
jgi:hypothetical protein